MQEDWLDSPRHTTWSLCLSWYAQQHSAKKEKTPNDKNTHQQSTMAYWTKSLRGTP